jgi:beta-lactamase superfamily II metal-dependent hydrolase
MAPRKTAPTQLTLRVYNVGFGDCFLLTFEYPGSTGNRHVLIDFGSTGKAEGASQTLLVDIANDIKAQTQGKLHAVVATHRHKDHISGFTTNAKKNGSGDIIASLKPDVVVQPWTEDPKAKPDATEATELSAQTDGKSLTRAFVGSLNNMHVVAASALAEARNPKSGMAPTASKQIAFLGDDNLSNESAIQNLMTMGRQNYYVNAGSKSGLESVLPGVNIRVLGPPTLKQSSAISKESSKNKDEFWFAANAFWGFQSAGLARAGTKKQLFPKAKLFRPADIPPRARWFVKHAQSIRAEQMLGLVRSLDASMNNTSVILLMDTGGKSLLFPGDAQFENWSFALSQKDVQEALKSVNLYKVGHHGSLNATPKSLWKLFENKSDKAGPHRLQTVVSTMAGKFGKTGTNTEVPRRTLVAELEKDSDFFSTQDLKSELCKTIVIPFGK